MSQGNSAPTPPESALFLTGTATYLDDLGDSHALLGGDRAHAVFVRSTSAHARFTVDTSAALGEGGVLAALCAHDNPIRPTGAYSTTVSPRFAQPLLAEGKVRFVGEPVAVVVAETRAQAVDAAELVTVEYEPLAAVMSVGVAVRDDVLLFADGEQCRRLGNDVDLGPETNIVLTAADGGVRSEHDPTVFDDAEVLIRRTFVNPRQVAAPIECRGTVAVWTPDGDLHVWLSTQTPHSFRDQIAPMYALDPARVHVVAGPFVGGGFGGKGAAGPEEQLIPHLARLVGRPVRWIETRSENLTAAPQGRSEEIELSLAGTADGRFEAIRVELRKDAGAYASSGAGLPNAWSQPIVTGTYAIPHAEFDAVVAVTNGPPISALRGAGRAPLIAALERSVDLYAAATGIDPAELRRRNLVQPDDMPYTSPVGSTYDEADYPAGLERVLVRGDYDGWRNEQARRRDEGDSRLIGIGLGSYNHKTMGTAPEVARVTINRDGSATIVTGTTSQGHGHAASWSLIAESELGIPADRITVIEGVTDAIATGIGAVGSRSVQTAGLAVHTASQAVVEAARALAAEQLEAAEVDIVLDKQVGAFHVAGTPARSLTWAEVADHGLECDRPLACDGKSDSRDNTYPSGCHLAVVEVDSETGGWRLLSYAAVDDAGVRIDSQLVDGQLHGGIALGIAQVMGEAMRFDADGNPLSGNFLDYPIATCDQLCSFDLEAQVVPTSVNKFGYKAVGESGPIGATPAVHNAVIDAVAPLRIDHIELPCTPYRVWQAITAALGQQTD